MNEERRTVYVDRLDEPQQWTGHVVGDRVYDLPPEFTDRVNTARPVGTFSINGQKFRWKILRPGL